MKKILIANRGEIAQRVLRTCNRMGIETVVVYSDADKNLPYIKEAEVAHSIGESQAEKSYMNMEKILEVAKKEQVDAIHPGYGFLSENTDFIRAVEDAGFIFIGPSGDVAEKMGDKVRARRTMEDVGVPVVPGSNGAVEDIEDAAAIAGDIGYPIMLKASAGGGGIGMQSCSNEEELRQAYESNQNRAEKYFGNTDMFIEKLVENGRHIEMQVFGDRFGNAVHLFERDCSIQRRNQKVVEETPTPFLSDVSKEKMYQAAVKAVKHTGYKNAGTIEFIVDEKENFYFLEMNTRLQVEHPITEETTGLDLVEWQIRIADGDAIPIEQREIRRRGHAMEFRLYAEDPVKFLPSPGTLTEFTYLEMARVRVDTGFESGSTATPFYDPLIAKVIASGSDRKETMMTARKFFKTLRLTGITHNVPLFERILDNGDFMRGQYTTNFLDELLKT